jgi:4-amino-4-deoxychorismate lyase
MPNWEGLREGAETLLTEFTVIRITIFADGRELILGRFLPENLAQKQQQGITAWVADTALFRRSLAAYKTGNYLSAWLALQQAQQLGAQEAILVDLEGNWLETSTGNLWGYGDGCWWTPPLDGQILPGIGRSQLLNWLQSQGLMVQESVWTAALIPNFEAIAYSNSVVEIIPIQQILVPENQLFLNFQHPALAQLHSYFHDR